MGVNEDRFHQNLIINFFRVSSVERKYNYNITENLLLHQINKRLETHLQAILETGCLVLSVLCNCGMRSM